MQQISPSDAIAQRLRIPEQADRHRSPRNVVLDHATDGIPQLTFGRDSHQPTASSITRRQWAATSSSRQPVFDHQAGNLSKVRQVSAEEFSVLSQHDGRDLQIQGADADARLSESVVFREGAFVEIEHRQ